MEILQLIQQTASDRSEQPPVCRWIILVVDTHSKMIQLLSRWEWKDGYDTRRIWERLSGKLDRTGIEMKILEKN